MARYGYFVTKGSAGVTSRHYHLLACWRPILKNARISPRTLLPSTRNSDPPINNQQRGERLVTFSQRIP